MRTTCCRHCIDGCNGVSGVWMHAAQEQPAGETAPVGYAVWQDGGCPMCAEAERIAAEVAKLKIPEPSTSEHHAYNEAIDAVEVIARGDA